MVTRSTSFQVAVRLSRTEFRRVRNLVSAGIYRSSADFVREAVRDKLREVEPVGIGEFPPREVEAKIDQYLSENPGPHFVSDMADSLGIGYREFFETVQRLLKNGKIKRTET